MTLSGKIWALDRSRSSAYSRQKPNCTVAKRQLFALHHDDKNLNDGAIRRCGAGANLSSRSDRHLCFGGTNPDSQVLFKPDQRLGDQNQKNRKGTLCRFKGLQ